jgi:hypothetical protein
MRYTYSGAYSLSDIFTASCNVATNTKAKQARPYTIGVSLKGKTSPIR